MHTIYTTPGFIIDSRAQGEAGKYLSIFTRDLGLVWTMAQGVRLEKSKLRYHLSDYSFAEFSLVRGKEVWRLTNADGIAGDLGLADEAPLKEFWARIAVLLRRLLHGEEPNPQLFEVIFACYRFLIAGSQSPAIDSANTTDFVAPINRSSLTLSNLGPTESLTVLRIMHALGYIGDDKEIHGFVYSNDFTSGILDLAARKKTRINQHINKALKESHL